MIVQGINKQFHHHPCTRLGLLGSEVRRAVKDFQPKSLISFELKNIFHGTAIHLNAPIDQGFSYRNKLQLNEQVRR